MKTVIIKTQMENTATMPATSVPLDKTKSAAKSKEHWAVEIVNGLTVATTMVSVLSLWYVLVAFVFVSPVGV
jgi:hypothetical protein